MTTTPAPCLLCSLEYFPGYERGEREGEEGDFGHFGIQWDNAQDLYGEVWNCATSKLDIHGEKHSKYILVRSINPRFGVQFVRTLLIQTACRSKP